MPRICIATLATMLRNTDPSGTDCYGWPCVWNCDSGRWHQFGRSDQLLNKVAISLREMSLVRCTLQSQSQPPFSNSVDETVLRIRPGVSSAMGWLQGHVSTERNGYFENNRGKSRPLTFVTTKHTKESHSSHADARRLFVCFVSFVVNSTSFRGHTTPSDKNVQRTKSQSTTQKVRSR